MLVLLLHKKLLLVVMHKFGIYKVLTLQLFHFSTVQIKQVMANISIHSKIATKRF